MQGSGHGMATDQGYRAIRPIDPGAGVGVLAGSGGVGVGFSLALKSGWRRARNTLGRAHILAKMMEVGKYRCSILGKVGGLQLIVGTGGAVRDLAEVGEEGGLSGSEGLA